MAFRIQIARKCRDQRAEMQWAGGRGREAANVFCRVIQASILLEFSEKTPMIYRVIYRIAERED